MVVFTSEAYWVSCYHSISDPAARAEYAKLAGPALRAAGGRYLAVANSAKVYSHEPVWDAKRWLPTTADEVKAQAKFRDKHELTVPLGSDTDHSVIEAYSAWGEKSMYGKKYMGTFRKTFLIDDGKIVKIFEKVDVAKHADEVLKAFGEK